MDLFISQMAQILISVVGFEKKKIVVTNIVKPLKGQNRICNFSLC